MDKKKLQQLIVMMPIILVAGVFCYIKYFLSPLSAKAKLLESDLESIRKDYRESEGRAARLPRLEQEIIYLNQEISEIEKKLPPNKDVPNLIRLLSKKMSNYDIVWNRLAPGSQVAKDYYIEHSYTIPFSATYHNLAKFLTDIGQMERIFASRFSNLTPEIDVKTGMIRVRGDLTFLIYTSKG